MNDVGLPDCFIDRVNRAAGLLQDPGTTYGENLRVDVLTKRALQIFSVVIAVKGCRDNGGFPSLRRRQ